jgi:hypothetical protein
MSEAEVKKLRDALEQANDWLRCLRDGELSDSEWADINDHLEDE